MPSPSPEALALGRRFRLALDHSPPRGPAGERLGRGTGSSLEFQDRRAYSVGDDVRHVDWRALARTDQLLVRQWREEILPRVEILIDTSLSMALEPAKAQFACDVVALLALAALESSAAPQLVLLGDAPRSLPFDEFERRGLEFDARASFADTLRAAGGLLRAGSIVLVVSDFLFPHDAAELVRPLGAKAGALALVQVLSSSEREPRAGGAHRLIDCESGAALDLVLDTATVTRYRERLARLGRELETEARRARGRFVELVADDPLERAARERLAREGLLEPR